jgi:TctA family transporter
MARASHPGTRRRFESGQEMSRGDPSTFVTRPILAGLIALAALLLALALLPMIRSRRDEVFVE